MFFDFLFIVHLIANLVPSFLGFLCILLLSLSPDLKRKKKLLWIWLSLSTVQHKGRLITWQAACCTMLKSLPAAPLCFMAISIQNATGTEKVSILNQGTLKRNVTEPEFYSARRGELTYVFLVAMQDFRHIHLWHFFSPWHFLPPSSTSISFRLYLINFSPL